MSDRIETEFAPARESVSWAEDAIAEFKDLVDGFFQGDLAEVITELDAQTGEKVQNEKVQKLRIRRPIPKDFRRKAMEALVSARHAFDQAAFAARNLTSGHSDASVYYPWSNSPTDMERLLKSRGFDERLWDTFASQEPYGRANTHSGGDDVIRTLAKLANDKHTVGLSIGGHISSTSFPNIHGKVVQSMQVLTPRWDSIKNEAELIRWIGDVEIQGDYKFRFEIVFKTSRLPHPVSALGGLSAFAAKAKAAIERLQARCAELAA